MSINSKVSFNELNLGSVQPTSVPMEVVHVEISSENLLGSYADAFIAEAYRVNPLRMEQINLTAEEVSTYCYYLLTKRIECVNNQCKDFRKLKSLYIPVWIQYNLSMIGEVNLRDRGLQLMPVMEPSKMTFDEAAKISTKIGMLEDDLQILQDAMPRDRHGDVDVMSTALIAGYMHSLNKVEHVSATYVSAFLGMKLREEVAFRSLYRVQYDDIGFIAAALTMQRGLF